MSIEVFFEEGFVVFSVVEVEVDFVIIVLGNFDHFELVVFDFSFVEIESVLTFIEAFICGDVEAELLGLLADQVLVVGLESLLL